MNDNNNIIEHLTSNIEPIHVVLLLYDPSGNYSQHAGVVMTSIFENTSIKVVILLLDDNTLTDENRRKFIRTTEKHSQCVKFYNVTKYRISIEKNIVPACKYIATVWGTV